MKSGESGESQRRYSCLQPMMQLSIGQAGTLPGKVATDLGTRIILHNYTALASKRQLGLAIDSNKVLHGLLNLYLVSLLSQGFSVAAIVSFSPSRLFLASRLQAAWQGVESGFINDTLALRGQID